jgi:hypothetical protein
MVPAGLGGDITIVFELLNDAGKRIGYTTVYFRKLQIVWSGRYSGISMLGSGTKRITMRNVNVNNITSKMTIRVASIDGEAPGSANNKNVRISTFDGDASKVVEPLITLVGANYSGPATTDHLIVDRRTRTILNFDSDVQIHYKRPSSIWGMRVKPDAWERSCFASVMGGAYGRQVIYPWPRKD